jgi:hypothetical protein
MMSRRTVFGVLAGGAAAVLSGCSFRRSFRYKMTVELETLEGIKIGYAVREVSFSARANGGDYGHVRGDAVAVDLPGAQTLFALLTSGDGDVDYGGDTMASLFKQLDRDEIQLWPDPPKTSAPIITNPVPMLVTFRDINDPTSVVRVEPAGMAAIFGPGVTLKRITVEVTDEPVTTGIEARLGWLGDPNRKRFPPNRKPEGIPLGNYKGLFSTELSK